MLLEEVELRGLSRDQNLAVLEDSRPRSLPLRAKKTCRAQTIGVLLHLQAKEDPSRWRRVAAVVHSSRVVAHDLAPVLCRRSVEPAGRSVEAPATVDVDDVAISCARERATLRFVLERSARHEQDCSDQ